MLFPSRDLTDQYISTSYQDVLQKYVTSSIVNVLDGYGNLIFTLPSSSIGGTIIVSNPSGSSYVSQSLLFNTTPATPPREEGQVYWDSVNHTLAIIPDITGSTLQVGQEMWLRALAHEFIPNGYAVYVSHAESGIPCIHLAIADGTGLKSSVIGVATHDIQSGSIGLITTMGQVRDIDTSMYSSGDTLYLSPTVSGSYQTTVPVDPYETVVVGYVLNSDLSSGKIEVSITDIGSKKYSFVGTTEIPTITSSSITPSGSFINVGVGRANFCETSDGTGLVKNYLINSASFSTTASFLDVQYVIATYNSGSPIYILSSTRDDVDEIQSTLVYTVTPAAGGRPSFASWDETGVLLANKNNLRVQALRKIEREEGVDLSVYDQTNRYFSITAGTAWQGVTPQSLSSIDSTTNRVVLVAHSASVWSGSLITQLINDRCDDGTNIVALGGGSQHWVVNYVYRTIGTLNATVVMLSTDYTSVTDAIASSPPTPPTEFLNTAFLVGRVIYKKDTIPEVQVDSAYTETFTPAGITIHNYLSGLQGGSELLGEYYHLTAKEYAGVNSYKTISSSYSVSITDGTIYASASSSNIILTLPAATETSGQFFRIKKIDSTGYEVIISSSINIDYDTELRLSHRGSSVTLHSDSTQYWIH